MAEREVRLDLCPRLGKRVLIVTALRFLARPDDQMRRHAQQHQGYRGARSWLRSSLRAREKVADRGNDQGPQGQLSDLARRL
jgi:hypothetical protein